jgi:hypothetical protein
MSDEQDWRAIMTPIDTRKVDETSTTADPRESLRRANGMWMRSRPCSN